MAKASATTARKLASLSADCSFLLTHMVRQNGNPPKSDGEARAILLSILGIKPRGVPKLRASSVGWFGSLSNVAVFEPSTGDFSQRDDCRAVCLTESSLAGLRAHRDVFSIKYGLSFDRDDLFRRGANPCLNIREDILKKKVKPRSGRRRAVFNYIPRELHPFVNVVNVAFDATHEREWRFPGDLQFAREDIRIVFCPEQDFRIFAAVQKNGLPMLFDLQWLDRM